MGKQKKNSNYVTEKTAMAKLEKEKAIMAAMKKKIFLAILIPIVSVLIIAGIIIGIGAACGWFYENPNADLEVTYHASIQIEGYDTPLHVELYGNDAPTTVARFVSLANSGYYNGTSFYKLVEDVMACAGKSSTSTITGEFSDNNKDNQVKHVRGTISMEKSGDKHSDPGKFFIVTETSDEISERFDGKYAAFGMVESGMEIIDEIMKNTETLADGTVLVSNQTKITSVTVHASH